MPRGEKGTARPYQRTGTAKWWIRYVVPGEKTERFESSGSKNKRDAWDLLRRRQDQIALGTMGPRGHENETDPNRPIELATPTLAPVPMAGEVTAGDLLKVYLAKAKGRASWKQADGYVRLHLQPAFGRLKAEALTTQLIDAFKDLKRRHEPPYAPASINRMLEVLKAAYKLGRENMPPLTAFKPKIAMEDESGNVRQGFLLHADYLRMREALPEHQRILLDIGYHWGMRRGEILSLKWSQVDWDGGLVRLDKMQTKGRTARNAPLYGDMQSILEAAYEARVPTCAFIVNFDGHGIVETKTAWLRARADAGLPELLIHDLRRTAVRNMCRAGISRPVAMLISGHKTESMYARYDITDEADLEAAGEKLATYYAAQKAALEKKNVQSGRKNVQSILEGRKRTG
jgi:integrase